MNTPLIKIIRPTLVISEKIAVNNLEQMVNKAKRSKAHFRPHFKTHQSSVIGEWYRKLGIKMITVSSVEMARFFAENGWSDITIAFPVNILEIENINKLAKNVRLHLLVESLDTVRYLDQHLKNPVQIWIKIDAGYHRTGIYWDDFSKIQEIIAGVLNSKVLTFQGLLTHSGHSYQTRGIRNLEKIYRDTTIKLNTVKDHLQKNSGLSVKISYGDTPTCSILSEFSEIDEIRPGNFIFYDVMQLQIGSCNQSQIAAALICPVVSKHPERGELVIHGGAVHLSKEFITDDANRKSYGAVVEWNGSRWGQILKNTYVSSLSQEHGIIKGDPAFIARMDAGTLLAILPVHSCLTMNLMRDFIII
jgi:D-serine deaminase-like pyridoxal phosphate-dependent protein